MRKHQANGGAITTQGSLTAEDLREHEQDEAIIERGLKSFYEVGSALLRIRDRRSYLKTHDSFEAYCKERWEINSSRARQLGLAVRTVDNLKTVTIVTPATESQCRPLTSLAPDDQREVWKRVTKISESEGQRITARLIGETADEYLAEVAPEPPDLDSIEDGPAPETEDERIEREAREWAARENAKVDEEHRKSQEKIRENHERAERMWERIHEKLNGLLNSPGVKMDERQKVWGKAMLELGFRAASKQAHPDAGGSHEDMVALTGAKDIMLAALLG